MRKLIALACLILVFASLATAQAKGGGSAEEAIRAADQGWMKVFAAHDVDKSAAYMAPGGQMLPPNGPAATTPAAIKKLCADFFAMPGMKLTWKPTTIQVSKSGDLGFSSGTYDMTFTANGKPASDKGKYVTIWGKQSDGSWKVVRDIFNSDMPAAH
jgi:uncharacterized protein (TIGR02246 family)